MLWRNLICFLIAWWAVRSANAQWSTQSIPLQPGWNAVYLEVQPNPDDCDSVFAGVPIESVWASTRRFTSVQFVQDPNTLVPGDPDWLAHAPADSPGRASRNLFTIQGGRPYLIKLKPGAAVTWTVKGQPVLRQVDWVPNALNFVGLPVGASNQPTFQTFFIGSNAHSGGPMFRLGANGQWQQVIPAQALVRAGEAYWIHCNGASSYQGPTSVTLEQRDGLNYGRTVTEQTIRIRNSSTARRSFSVEEIASATPPNGSTPLLAGRVPLSYYNIDTTNSQFGWLPLTSRLTRELAAGEEWVLRLAVNRPQMANFNAPAQHNGVLYQSLLAISGSSGVRFVAGVSSEGLRNFGTGLQEGQLAASATSEPAPHTGLWIGTAVIDRVSQPANVASPNTPLPVGALMQFRLIVHVDQTGQVRLLQKVLEMFRNGTLKEDPTDATRKVIDEPGRYVLLTDDSLIPNFTGSALRDGEPVSKRVSSAAFGFKEPILFSSSSAFGTGTFTGQVNLDYDDPVNPFKHRFHPDHDNLDDRFQAKLPVGRESFSVSRQIQMEFSTTDPDNLTFAGWGDNQLGGDYRETISGLHNKAISISGTFRLTKVSSIGVLNDGMQ